MTQNNYRRLPARGVNRLGAASLCVGLIAAAGFWAPSFGMAIVPLAVIGLILGFVGFIVAASGGRSGTGIPVVASLLCIGVIGVSVLMAKGFIGATGATGNKLAQPEAPVAGQPAMPVTQVPVGGVSVPGQGVGPVSSPDDSIFSPGYQPGRSAPSTPLPAPVKSVDSARILQCKTAVADATGELANRQSDQTRAVNAAVAARHLQPDYVALAKTASDLRVKIDDMREHRADADEIEPLSKQWLGYRENLAQMDNEPTKSPAVLDAIAKVKAAGDALAKANAALVQAGGGQ